MSAPKGNEEAPEPAESAEPIVAPALDDVEVAASASPDVPGVEPQVEPEVETPQVAGAPAAGQPRDLRRYLRRFGPAVVAIGVAVFASPLADRWPSTQAVEIALDAPGEVTRVTLAVAARGEVEPVLTTTWNFDRGTAPERVHAEIATPNGPYDATIGVSRAGAPTREETKRIELDGNRITLFAR